MNSTYDVSNRVKYGIRGRAISSNSLKCYFWASGHGHLHIQVQIRPRYFIFSAYSVHGQDGEAYPSFFLHEFEGAKRGDWFSEHMTYGPEGVVLGFIPTESDVTLPSFVDGSNITKSEADIICKNEDSSFLGWGQAIKWDTNRNRKYFSLEENESRGYRENTCMTFKCPEGAEHQSECEWNGNERDEPCDQETYLVIWCDIGDVNWFEFSLGGAKVDLGLNELIQHWLFE